MINDIGFKNIFLINPIKKLIGAFIMLNIILKILLITFIIPKLILNIILLIKIKYIKIPNIIAKNINNRISPLLYVNIEYRMIKPVKIQNKASSI